MKKILCIVLFFFLSMSTYGAMQYGITAVTNSGAGITLLGSKFSLSTLYSNIQNRDGFDEDEIVFEFNAKYKFSLDEKSNVLLGIRHLLISLKTPDDDDSDENMKTAFTAGIDHQLTNRVIVFTETDIYSTQTVDDGLNESSFFESTRFGVTLLVK